MCINVVARILKDPTHSIIRKKIVKSHHNTRSSHYIPATVRTKSYKRTAAYKKNYDLKEMDMSTNTQIQTNTETTTPENITIIQVLKLQAKKCMTQKSLRSDFKTISTKALTTESTTISNTKWSISSA
jgi:hypothetical protein